jgi:hypothetical protein
MPPKFRMIACRVVLFLTIRSASVAGKNLSNRSVETTSVSRY